MVRRLVSLSAGVSCCLAIACSALGSRSNASGEPPVGEPAQAPFTASYLAGQRDASGQFMGGTEVMSLVAYKGKLYAGIGYAGDNPGGDPIPGAQLLVRDSAAGPWRVAHAFNDRHANGSPKFLRVSGLVAAVFTTDGAGKALPNPESRLVVAVSGGGVVGEAAASGAPGEGARAGEGTLGALFVWDDEQDVWTRTSLNQPARALTFFTDPITGVGMVFAGSGDRRGAGAGIFTGVYEPSAPGGIHWSDQPETTDFTHRVVGFVACAGQLYFASRPALFRRENGESPRWTRVYSYPEASLPKRSSGLRGLACADNLGAPGKAILGVKEGRGAPGGGEVVRIDPATGEAKTELHIAKALAKLWGVDEQHLDFSVAGPYEPALLLKAAGSPESFHLIGLGLSTCLRGDPCRAPGKERSAWYLRRDARASYSLAEVKPLGQPTAGTTLPLFAIRTISESPFPEEAGAILYLGGTDTDLVRYGGPSFSFHNTAWLYRVGLRTALTRATPLPSVP